MSGRRPPRRREARRARTELEDRVRAIVAALDAKGRWIAGGRSVGRRPGYRGMPAIRTDTFIASMDTRCEYLTLTK